MLTSSIKTSMLTSMLTTTSPLHVSPTMTMMISDNDTSSMSITMPHHNPMPLPYHPPSLGKQNPKRQRTNYPVSNNDDDIDGDWRDYFVYHGLKDEVIPKDVTHVILDTSVKVIIARAFAHCMQLVTVILCDCEGLEEIGDGALFSCALLELIIIPNAVKTIKQGAFNRCWRLKIVTLGDGLEKIEKDAFNFCSSLQHFIIPNAVKAINERTFYDCSGLTTVTLGDGLEEIGKEAFYRCTSLQRIVHTPCRQDDKGWGIQKLRRVEDCKTLRGAGGNWLLVIWMVYKASAPSDPSSRQGN
jgi:hypothetical protein